MPILLTNAPMNKILVVDDDQHIRELAGLYLEKDGFSVDYARDGQEALASFRRGRPDLVVLDVMMPPPDGFEVCRVIRGESETTVLMLTARDQSRDRVKGLDTGADDYVVKPFDLPELLARLRALIRRTAGKTTSLIEIGDVVVDLAARVVSLKRQPVELTAREYQLVEFMALHRGEVVSRTQLYEHLFDENDSSLSNLLDVHVSNVRKKLGADFVTTRRGLGYCIE